MKSEEFIFEGPNGWKLLGRFWPSNQPQACLVGVHGYSEHSGCYDHVAEFFAVHGIESLWLDLPGHGKSDGRRANIDNFSDYIKSIEALIDEASKRSKPKPQFIFGHSLGGLIVTRFLQSSSKAPLFKRSALSSPLFGLSQYSPKALPFLQILTNILPNISLPNSAELGGDVLTHDVQMKKKREMDVLIKSQVTVNWTREFLKARKLAFKNVDHIKIPIALFQAGDERVVDRSEAERFFSLVESHKQVKVYDKFFHEILNEVNREQVLNDILRWYQAGL